MESCPEASGWVTGVCDVVLIRDQRRIELGSFAFEDFQEEGSSWRLKIDLKLRREAHLFIAYI